MADEAQARASADKKLADDISALTQAKEDVAALIRRGFEEEALRREALSAAVASFEQGLVNLTAPDPHPLKAIAGMVMRGLSALARAARCLRNLS